MTSSLQPIAIQQQAVVGNVRAHLSLGGSGGRRRRPWPGGPRTSQPALQASTSGRMEALHAVVPQAANSPVQPPSYAAQSAAAPTYAAVDADAVAAAERESLELLEWPALCYQVACFAQTPMGAEVALRCALPLGCSQQESERLLQQTEEAQRAQLEFQGVYDVRLAVEAAVQQRVLHPLVLGAVATTLAASSRLQHCLTQQQQQQDQEQRKGQHRGGDGQFVALLELAAGIGSGLPEVQRAIEQCIQPGEGRILDTASPALAEVREQRRRNSQELRAEMERWARLAHAQGISERPQVVVRRDRLCIPVRAGRQGELPRGSVTLATSTSGSTLYMEPQPAVALNNAEMALAGREAEEEAAVLMALSNMVAQHARQLRSVLSSITALDVASARARHAAWMGATSPPRFLTPEEAAAGGPVQLPRAWHPLLLQPCLPQLSTPPVPEEMLQQPRQQQQQQAELDSPGPLTDLALVPELAAAAAPQPAGPVGSSLPRCGKGSSSSSAAGDAQATGDAGRAPLPQPVDLTVPPGVKVVAVTGPNTGGKTASLKALGLSCLMAKAGLFLPQAPPQQTQQHHGQVQGLLWFDRVLADLGDGQSLQQSLSTFSGHLRRIRNVLAAATSQSLVLLDEVGSGTDPAEGAALAAALLERLQRQAALTYATTHHAELKDLAASTPGFVNANVEFDVASLRPTYRLLWGSAGDSNALAVAQSLGFSPAVVAAAREVAQQLHQSGQAAGKRSQLLQASLVEELEEARQAAAQAAATRAAYESAAATAQRELEQAQQRQAGLKKEVAKLKGADVAAQKAVQQLLSEVRAGRLAVQEAEERLRVMEQDAAAPESAAVRLMGLRAAANWGGTGLADDSASSLQEAEEERSHGSSSNGAVGGDWRPVEGEAVRVLKMGGAAGKVVSAAARSGGKVCVRVGSLTVELRLSDLAPAGSQMVQQAATSSGGSSRRPGSSVAKSLGAASKQLRARGLLSSDSDSGSGSGGADRPSPPGMAIQTSRNTVDVRGQRAEEAAAEVQAAALSAPSGWTLFVVHGVGTGRVRAAVLNMLRQHPRVEKLEEAEASNGGCTIAHIK